MYIVAGACLTCFPFVTQVRNKWQWDVNVYIGTTGAVVIHFPKGNEE